MDKYETRNDSSIVLAGNAYFDKSIRLHHVANSLILTDSFISVDNEEKSSIHLHRKLFPY